MRINIEKCLETIKNKQLKIDKLQSEIDEINDKINSHIQEKLQALTIEYFKCKDENRKADLEKEIRRLMEVGIYESK